MTRQRLGLFILLALLLLLVGLADLSHGEDYYMQELLTREQYNQVQVPQKAGASIADRHEHAGQYPAKNVPKDDSSKETDKTAADAKTGKKEISGIRNNLLRDVFLTW